MKIEDFTKRIEESFQKQGFMQHLGASLVNVQAGEVIVSCELSSKVDQQNGYFHAGAMAGLADTACGYAALSLMPDDADVLSVEFKVNLLRPGNTKRIISIGRVIKNGKTLVICEGEVWDEEKKNMLLKMLATMIVSKKKSSKND